MASFGSQGCPTMIDYFCDFCPNPEQGRISAVAFVTKGTPLPDPSSRQDWVNVVCNKLGFIIPDVRGSYDAQGIEQPGFGRTHVRRTGSTHTVTYSHLFTCENIEVYNSLNNNAGQYEFWFSTETKLFASKKEVYINANMPITDDTNAQIEFTVEVKWSNKYIPECYSLPTGIFDSCEGLQSALTCLTCQPLIVNPC